MGIVFVDRYQEMLPLVESLARGVATRLPAGVETSDLIQEGLLALLEAEHRYQSHRGVPLWAYAHSRVRGRMLDMLRSLDWASRHARRRARELSRAEETLALKLGRSPSARELSQHLQIDRVALEQRRQEAANLRLEPLGELQLAARPSSEPTLETREALDRLPARQRQILSWHYFEGIPLREIAGRLGVTEARASQLHRGALSRLRAWLAEEAATPEKSSPGRARSPRRCFPPSPRPACA